MAKRKIQWHPLFARLLRPHIEGYYEIRLNVPVGDLPRQADVVLLRRLPNAQPPFAGLWRHLTAWNVLEFKGPTVTPRQRDLALLIELGLGIDRRLSAERKQKRFLEEKEVSFWYLSNQLGARFLKAARQRLPDLRPYGDGVWRAQVLGYPCLLVSTVDLPVDEDSLPLHVLGIEPAQKQRQVGSFVAERAERVDQYGSIFAMLHGDTWQEVMRMARATRGKLTFDVRPLVETMGLGELIKQIGEKAVIEQIGEKAVIKRIGKKKVLEQIDVDDILANWPRAKRQELIRRLQQRSGKAEK